MFTGGFTYNARKCAANIIKGKVRKGPAGGSVTPCRQGSITVRKTETEQSIGL